MNTLRELATGCIVFLSLMGSLLVIGSVHQIITAQTPHGTASEEVPRGAIDGVNATFTLNFQPAPWGSIHVFRNGLRLQRHLDYELGGLNHTQIIFTTNACPTACIPQSGPPADVVLVDYMY